tara:strand:+ start:4471 stop:4740 length:270 start_codon:yes stop_codon:yes gene_type:complete
MNTDTDKRDKLATDAAAVAREIRLAPTRAKGAAIRNRIQLERLYRKNRAWQRKTYDGECGGGAYYGHHALAAYWSARSYMHFLENTIGG